MTIDDLPDISERLKPLSFRRNPKRAGWNLIRHWNFNLSCPKMLCQRLHISPKNKFLAIVLSFFWLRHGTKNVAIFFGWYRRSSSSRYRRSR